MPSKKRGQRQAARRAYAAKVHKLQRAGYLKNVDVRKKPTPAIFASFTKHRDILSGRAAVLKAPSNAKARELRKRIGAKGAGKTVIIPREKGEKIRITKSGEIKSHRERYGQTIDKTIGAPLAPPTAGTRQYYTIPRRRRGTAMLKRHTFASFDELLFYLTKYEVEFEDIEDYIEVETIRQNSPEETALHEKIARERRNAKRARRRKSRR